MNVLQLFSGFSFVSSLFQELSSRFMCTGAWYIPLPAADSNFSSIRKFIPTIFGDIIYMN
jgi:hypothetical protein